MAIENAVNSIIRVAKDEKTYPKVVNAPGLGLSRGTQPEEDGEEEAETDACPKEDVGEIGVRVIGEDRGEQSARDARGHRHARANGDAVERR